MILDIGGQRVTVEDSFAKLSPADQQATVDEIASSLAPKAEASTPEMSGGGIAADVAKSGGVGLAKGAIGLAGLPGDVSELGARGLDRATRAIGGLFGLDIAARPDQPTRFGATDIQGAVEGVTGEFYKPKTTAGEYAQTGGEFVPGMIGGPGSLAMRAATRVALPALASETAGQITEGTAAEPYARVAGALAGGGAGARIASGRASGVAQNTVPSADDLLKSGDAGFKSVLKSGATIDPNDAAIIAQGIKAKIAKEGARPASQPALFAELDRLEELGKAGQRLDMGDMESVRKAINDLKLSPDGSVRTHAKTAVTELMDLQTQVLPANVAKTLKNAIGDWAAGKRSNTVMGKAALGDLNASTAGAGANGDNALRQAIKQLARPIHNTNTPVWKKLGYSDAEGAAIEGAARGTTGGNAARFVGKLAPTGIVSGGMSSGAGFAMGGPLGAVALPAAGYVAKKIGDMSTQKAIKALDSLVRSRSPLAQQVAAQLPPQIVQQLPAGSRALLTALSVAQATRAPQVPALAQGSGY